MKKTVHKDRVVEKPLNRLTLVTRFLEEHSFMLDTLLVLLVIICIGFNLGMKALDIMPETYLTHNTQGLGLVNDEAKVAVLCLHIVGTMVIFTISLLAININMWLWELGQVMCKKIKKLKLLVVICLYLFLSILTTVVVMVVSKGSLIAQIYTMFHIVISLGCLVGKAVKNIG